MVICHCRSELVPAMKVDPVMKRATGTASKQEGAGAVFLEKCHQNDGFLVDIIFS